MITENEDMMKVAEHLIDVTRLVGKTIDPSLVLNRLKTRIAL